MGNEGKTFTGLSSAELEIALLIFKGLSTAFKAAKAKGVDLEALVSKMRAENEFGIHDVLGTNKD